MKLELDTYQSKGIFAASLKMQRLTKIVFQLSTGGGKTVIMSNIAARFAAKSGLPVLILVHREELLISTVNTLYKWAEIIGFPIVPGKRLQIGHSVYVGMVETVNNLNPGQLPKFGMIMLDEAHLGNFKKIHAKFEGVRIMAFTATPLFATKAEAMNEYYEDIVCCIDTPELIEVNKNNPARGLVQNKTYNIKGAVNRKELKANGMGDFNEGEMSKEFSKTRNVANTVEAYLSQGNGKKAVCFNCNREHSQLVTQAFIAAGVPARHLDSYEGGVTEDGRELDKKAWRKDCLRWLKVTPGAVLNNVGILTTGFDEPSIEIVIVNRATMSLTLWLQMTGRGSRPWIFGDYTKKLFTILDLGGNAVTHGDWCDARNWADIFFNPPKPGAGGVAPVKECPSCEALISAGASTCKFCGAQQELKSAPPVYDRVKLELELFTKNIDVSKLEEERRAKDFKPYQPLFAMARDICREANVKLKASGERFNKEVYNNLLSLFNSKAKEWYNIKKERFTTNKEKFTSNIFDREAVKYFSPAETPKTQPA